MSESIFPPHRHTYPSVTRIALTLIAMGAALFTGCGGSGGGNGNPPPSADFTLAASPTALTVTGGQSTTTSVSVAALSGFSSQVFVTVSGLPAGVTASPATLSIAPGTPQTLTLDAASSVAASTATVTLTGSSGSNSHSVQLALTVKAVSTTPVADFTLSASPATLTVTGGASAATSVSVNPSNGFASQVSVAVSGLPSGVTASPASLSLTPGMPQTLTLTAAKNVAASTGAVTLTGTSGGLSHSLEISLTVKTAPASSSGLSRTKYIRTDAVTPYGFIVNQSWVIFDPPTDRFFVSDPYGNQVDVLDANTETLIGSIAVPGAFEIDETLDHKTIYVGTQVGDIYAIDPVAMQVTKRYKAETIGPLGYQASSARTLANGELALIGGPGGIPSVDGYATVAVWNPVTNAIKIYGTAHTIGSAPTGSYTTVCGTLENIGAFTLTGDHSKIVIGSIDGDGTLCTIDPVTGKDTFIAPGGFLFHVTATPDGKSLILPGVAGSSAGAVVYDAATLTQTNAFPVSGDTSSDAQFAVSADSKTLYVTSTSILYAYDIASGSQIGWAPNLYVSPTSSGFEVGSAYGPNIQATDNTGLLVGPMEEGVGFLDTTALHTGAVGSQFLNSYLNPATGPTTGGTETQWEAYSSSDLDKVYFGSNLATGLSTSASGIFSAITPAGAPGTVDVTTIVQDGGEQIVPEGFSYGPTLVQATPNLSTAEGGGTGVLFGYGFGPVDGSTAIPSDLSLTIGGQAAKILSFSGNAYELGSPPFPLQSITYTVPAGSAGSSSIGIKTASGSVTSSDAFSYLQKSQQFPLPGAQLVQGIYDPKRDLYYFTDAGQIQVFSRTQGKWLTPMSVPAAPKGSAHRLWGIGLSPNGNTLAVSDAGARAIYAFSPDSPSSVTTFNIPLGGQGTPLLPGSLAVSDAQIIYFLTYDPSGVIPVAYHNADIATGTITGYSIQDGGTVSATDAYRRVALSSDGARLYINNAGDLIALDTASATLVHAGFGPGFGYGDLELSLAPNDTQLDSASYLYDADLNGASYLAENDREALDVSYVYGAKLSPDASLLFAPTVNGIDVFDGRYGRLLNRISIPEALSENFDALVSDGQDNVLIAITGVTGTGIAVVDLTSLAEPPPIPYLTRSTARENHPPGEWADIKAQPNPRSITSIESIASTAYPPALATARPARRYATRAFSLNTRPR